MKPPTDEVISILAPAHGPCAAFQGVCQSMRWAPELGHVPRGYLGATGAPEEVRLVLVCAEPGDPHDQESYSPGNTLSEFNAYAYECFREGTDLFHRNIRLIMNLCFPGTSFDDQLRLTWITDSVLCSANVETGHVPTVVARECRRRYLEPQLRLFRNAVVAALGGKAQGRLKGWPDLIGAFAAAPPGCNQRRARPSWDAIATAVQGQQIV